MVPLSLISIGCDDTTDPDNNATTNTTDSSALETVAANNAQNDEVNNKESKNITGKVIDGYIQDAKVFVDLNENMKFDEGEPSAITDENGSYTIEDFKMDPKKDYQIISIDGTDVNTNEEFNKTLVSIVNQDTLKEDKPLVVSPTTTLVASEYLKNPKAGLSKAEKTVKEALNINSDKSLFTTDFIAEKDAHLFKENQDALKIIEIGNSSPKINTESIPDYSSLLKNKDLLNVINKDDSIVENLRNNIPLADEANGAIDQVNNGLGNLTGKVETGETQDENFDFDTWTKDYQENQKIEELIKVDDDGKVFVSDENGSWIDVDITPEDLKEKAESESVKVGEYLKVPEFVELKNNIQDEIKEYSNVKPNDEVTDKDIQNLQIKAQNYQDLFSELNDVDVKTDLEQISDKIEKEYDTFDKSVSDFYDAFKKDTTWNSLTTELETQDFSTLNSEDIVGDKNSPHYLQIKSVDLENSIVEFYAMENDVVALTATATFKLSDDNKTAIKDSLDIVKLDGKLLYNNANFDGIIIEDNHFVILDGDYQDNLDNLKITFNGETKFIAKEEDKYSSTQQAEIPKAKGEDTPPNPPTTYVKETAMVNSSNQNDDISVAEKKEVGQEKRKKLVDSGLVYIKNATLNIGNSKTTFNLLKNNKDIIAVSNYSYVNGDVKIKFSSGSFPEVDETQEIKDLSLSAATDSGVGYSMVGNVVEENDTSYFNGTKVVNDVIFSGKIVSGETFQSYDGTLNKNIKLRATFDFDDSQQMIFEDENGDKVLFDKDKIFNSNGLTTTFDAIKNTTVENANAVQVDEAVEVENETTENMENNESKVEENTTAIAEENNVTGMLENKNNYF